MFICSCVFNAWLCVQQHLCLYFRMYVQLCIRVRAFAFLIVYVCVDAHVCVFGWCFMEKGMYWQAWSDAMIHNFASTLKKSHFTAKRYHILHQGKCIINMEKKSFHLNIFLPFFSACQFRPLLFSLLFLSRKCGI